MFEGTGMKKVVLIAAAALTGVFPAVAFPAVTGPAPAEYHAMLQKYCITCHNEKLKLPAGAPLYLDKADLDNPAADPAVWERVYKKLNVGAMPPKACRIRTGRQSTVFRHGLPECWIRLRPPKPTRAVSRCTA